MISVISGANQAFTITANANYHIADVLVDGMSDAGAISTGSYTFTNVTMDHTISATFAINEFTLTLNGTNGSIDASPAPNGMSGKYLYGTVVSLHPDPANGYYFTGFTGACTAANPFCTVTIDADKTVTASFDTAADFDAVRDFNGVTNTGGRNWQYGYSEVDGSGFNSYTGPVDALGGGLRSYPYAPADMAVAQNTTGADFDYNICTRQQADVLAMYPGSDGRKTVVRWTAPASGAYQITGRFQNIDTTSTDVSVVKGSAIGSPLFTDTVFGGACRNLNIVKNFSVAVIATAGDTIDFRVGDGGNGFPFDGTGLAATVTPIGQQVLTVSHNAAGSITSDPTGIDCGPTCSAGFDYGTEVTLTATADVGYHFVSWGDDCAGFMTPACTLTMDGSKTASATFAINTYTLTYTAGANGMVSGTSPQTVNYGASGTAVTAVPNAGYHFVNWSDASTQNPRTDTNVMANVSVTANFALDVCSTPPAGMVAWYPGETDATDIFGPNNGTEFGGTTHPAGRVGQAFGFDGSGQRVSATDNPSLNSTTGTWNYWFRTTQSGVNAGIIGKSLGFDSLLGLTFFLRTDGKLEAFISNNAPGANLVSTGVVNDGNWHLAAMTFSQGGSMILYVDGQPVDTDVTPAFTFAGGSELRIGRLVDTFWSSFAGEVDEVQIYNSVLTAGDIAAIYDAGSAGNCQVYHTLTTAANPMAGGSVTQLPNRPMDQHLDGATVQLTAVSNPGYSFTSWTGDVTNTAVNPTTIVMADDETVTANFATDTYTVGGTVSGLNGSGLTLQNNLGNDLPIIGNGPFTFSTPLADGGIYNVTVSAQPFGPPQTCSVMGGSGNINGTDVTNVAVTCVNTYTLTYTPGSNGTISGTTPQMVNHGASGTAVTAVPNPGYTFNQWSDGNTNASRTDMNVMASATYTASFTAIEYTLNITPAGNGSGSVNRALVTVALPTYHYGDMVELTAVPDMGSTFAGFTGDFSGGSPLTITITGNTNITATFNLLTYSLNYIAGPGGTISGNTMQTVNYGEDGTAVMAVPDAGYLFVDWTPGNSASASRTDMNVMANATYTANFTPNDVTFNATGNLASGTYNNVVINGPAVVTMLGNVVINGCINRKRRRHAQVW